MSSKVSLEHIRAFMAVAEAGGFTAAAKSLGATKNLLSKEVAKLEADLGIALFVRTTRRVELTSEGERLRDAIVPLLLEIDRVLQEVGAHRLSGLLRVTAPADYVKAVLGRLLADFVQEHDDLRLDLVSDNRVRDLVADRIDLAVRIGWLRDSSLRATRVGEFELVVVASPAYLRQAGIPRHPTELSAHPFIGLSVLPEPGHFWFQSGAGKKLEMKLKPKLSANTVDGLLDLSRSGAGLTLCADFAAADDIAQGALCRVLEGWSAGNGGIYLVWPHAKHESAKVRALISYLKTHLNG